MYICFSWQEHGFNISQCFSKNIVEESAADWPRYHARDETRWSRRIWKALGVPLFRRPWLLSCSLSLTSTLSRRYKSHHHRHHCHHINAPLWVGPHPSCPRMSEPGGQRGHVSPIFADQLTLFWLGCRLCPQNYYLPPPEFIELPTALLCLRYLSIAGSTPTPNSAYVRRHRLRASLWSNFVVNTIDY